MKSSAKTRQMKVYNKIMLRRENFQYGSYSVTFPEIRLMGKWLQDCGFNPGQQIEVYTEANKLTITVCTGNKNEPSI